MITLEKAVATQQIDHYIDGQFVPSKSGKFFDDTNPATGELVARVAEGSAEDVDIAVKAAKKAAAGPWTKMSLKERCDVLRKIGDLILANRDLLAQAETADTGKPIAESRDGDIPRAAQNFHFFADYAQSITEECFTVSGLERHFAVREPVGVAALITPWNLPLYLATWKIAPCLAMGNSCILKPAEWTPLTAYLLGHIVTEAGLPEGVLNIVHGFGPDSAGEALSRHPDVAALSFTGETTTGKAIMAASSQTLKKLSFELGGKGANIIFDDADLSEAIPASVRAAYRNQGQICLAGSRLYVQKGVYKEVVERLADAAQKLRVGDPKDPSTQMGSLISSEHRQKVEQYIEIGRQEGKLVTGGERLSHLPKGNFLSPAVITDLPAASRVLHEEIFGPVLPVVPFETEEEAIALTNESRYGLSASLWSQDVDRCHRVASKIKTGIVWVNCWFARDLRTPFGGQKASGIGREGGRYGLDFFSELKTICYKYKG